MKRDCRIWKEYIELCANSAVAWNKSSFASEFGKSSMYSYAVILPLQILRCKSLRPNLDRVLCILLRLFCDCKFCSRLEQVYYVLFPYSAVPFHATQGRGLQNMDRVFCYFYTGLCVERALCHVILLRGGLLSYEKSPISSEKSPISH